VRFSCLLRGRGASFQDGVAVGKGFLCAPFWGVQICDYSARNSRCTVICKRTSGSAWETWAVAAADGVRCIRVRWEINFLLTFETAPFFCVYPVFAEYSQQDAKFHNFFISVRRYTCFRWFFRPSSGTQNCTYSVRYLSDQYLTLCVQFWAPDVGRTKPSETCRASYRNK